MSPVLGRCFINTSQRQEAVMGGADILRLQAQSSLALSCSEADTVKSPQYPRLSWSRAWLWFNSVFAKFITLDSREFHPCQSQQFIPMTHSSAHVSQGWAERAWKDISLRQQRIGLKSWEVSKHTAWVKDLWEACGGWGWNARLVQVRV